MPKAWADVGLRSFNELGFPFATCSFTSGLEDAGSMQTSMVLWPALLESLCVLTRATRSNDFHMRPELTSSVPSKLSGRQSGPLHQTTLTL